VSVRQLNGAVFAHRAAADGRHGEQQLVAGGSDSSLFAGTARLDNREELGSALSIAPAELAHMPDSALVLRMFERWGEAGLARCLGGFAFAFWDADARRLTLARDCLGQHALFFFRGRDFVAFATTLRALLALPGIPRDLDELALASFLALNFRDARRTFYCGVERVPSRTLLAIDRNGISSRHYWSPDLDAPQPYRRDEDYVERARELFDQAVAAATAGTHDIAIAASGGLDSSAVAATAARLGRGGRIACYALVPSASSQVNVGAFKYWDERDKVEALARMYSSLDVRFIAPEDPHPFEEDDSRYFARTAFPVLNPGNMGWFSYLYDDVVASGHRALLTGQRGNMGLSWAGRFSLLALLRTGRLAGFARELSAVAQQSGRSVPRAFASEVLAPGGPLWLRRLLYRLVRGDPDSVAFYSALNPEFIAEHDLVRRWQAQGFQEPWFHGTGWNGAAHRARWLFDHNQFSRDAIAATEEHHGFALRDPHSDRRLLEFLLTVPEWMYRQNGVARSFARRVLADRLPREILDERRRGAQAGAWFRRLDMRRQDIAADIESLDNSPLARRLLDVPRLKRLMAEWPKDEHAAELRKFEYHLALGRGLHVGRFIRWVEGGNA
jgi:asparagine synthase (glutamine-hydrolysing)